MVNMIVVTAELMCSLSWTVSLVEPRERNSCLLFNTQQIEKRRGGRIKKIKNQISHIINIAINVSKSKRLMCLNKIREAWQTLL